MQRYATLLAGHYLEVGHLWL